MKDHLLAFPQELSAKFKFRQAKIPKFFGRGSVLQWILLTKLWLFAAPIYGPLLPLGGTGGEWSWCADGEIPELRNLSLFWLDGGFCVATAKHCCQLAQPLQVVTQKIHSISNLGGFAASTGRAKNSTCSF